MLKSFQIACTDITEKIIIHAPVTLIDCRAYGRKVVMYQYMYLKKYP